MYKYYKNDNGVIYINDKPIKFLDTDKLYVVICKSDFINNKVIYYPVRVINKRLLCI